MRLGIFKDLLFPTLKVPLECLLLALAVGDQSWFHCLCVCMSKCASGALTSTSDMSDDRATTGTQFEFWQRLFVESWLISIWSEEGCVAEFARMCQCSLEMGSVHTGHAECSYWAVARVHSLRPKFSSKFEASQLTFVLFLQLH